jgi:hypothetical protein
MDSLEHLRQESTAPAMYPLCPLCPLWLKIFTTKDTKDTKASKAWTRNLESDTGDLILGTQEFRHLPKRQLPLRWIWSD